MPPTPNQDDDHANDDDDYAKTGEADGRGTRSWPNVDEAHSLPRLGRPEEAGDGRPVTVHDSWHGVFNVVAT